MTRMRRTTGCRGPNCGDADALGAPTAVGARGPPSDGMQPAKGMKLEGRPAGPTDIPVNTTMRPVVIPGLTGAPTRPSNVTSTHPSPTRASVPPTTPFGHSSIQTLLAVPARRAGPGTTTQGPAMGPQIVRPSQVRGGSIGLRPSAEGTAATIPASTAANSTRFTAPSSTKPPRATRRRRGSRSLRARTRTTAPCAFSSCRGGTRARDRPERDRLFGARRRSDRRSPC